VPERTEQPEQQPTPTQYEPQLNSVTSEPATVEACQADYAAGADIRARLGWIDA
jgi:hypothetical protein